MTLELLLARCPEVEAIRKLAGQYGIEQPALPAGEGRLHPVRAVRAHLPRAHGPGRGRLRGPRGGHQGGHPVPPRERGVPGLRGLRVGVPHPLHPPEDRVREARRCCRCPSSTRACASAPRSTSPSPRRCPTPRSSTAPTACTSARPSAAWRPAASAPRPARPRPSTTAQTDKTVELEAGAVILAPGFCLYDPAAEAGAALHHLPQRGHEPAVRAHPLGLRPLHGQGAAPLGLPQAPAASPSSSAWAPATRSTTTAPRCAACTPSRRRSSPRSTRTDIACDVFYMDIRAHGKGFDAYYERAKELGIRFTRCRPSQDRGAAEPQPAHRLRGRGRPALPGQGVRPGGPLGGPRAPGRGPGAGRRPSASSWTRTASPPPGPSTPVAIQPRRGVRRPGPSPSPRTSPRP